MLYLLFNKQIIDLIILLKIIKIWCIVLYGPYHGVIHNALTFSSY